MNVSFNTRDVPPTPFFSDFGLKFNWGSFDFVLEIEITGWWKIGGAISCPDLYLLLLFGALVHN
jgi:hypothetical protein